LNARTHAEPFRSILAGADDALTRARAYLCIGYGFNDTHIQPKLMDRWRHGDAMLVIVTKELTDATRSLLRGCTSQNFLALEEATGGTRMLTAEYPNGIIIEDASLWRLADLMDQAI
jgi:hypothetical protein